MLKSDLLSNLNPQQHLAVTAPDGPVLVLAGAGSGKTKTLVHRIAYLIQERGVLPEQIVAVTFTNKAAGEMLERVERLLGDMGLGQRRPSVGTFHALSVRILRTHAAVLGYKPSFIIYDDGDAKSLIKQILLDRGINPKQYSPDIFYGAIERAKNSLLNPEDYAAQDGNHLHELIAAVYAEYQKRLQELQAFDFGDLIGKVVELWQVNPEILAQYQDRWHHILIDEYQDTNTAQYRWVKLLAERRRQLYVVGDDAQSIYLFRGADIANILSFEKDYPEAVIVALEQNYRSTQNILDASNAIISGNTRQKKKKLWTENPIGDPVRVAGIFDQRAEAVFILDQIALETVAPKRNPHSLEVIHEELSYEAEDDADSSEFSGVLDRIMERGQARGQLLSRDYSKLSYAVDLNRYVILYRTNAQSRAIEEVFLQASVPYRIIGGLRFYERKEIKDMIAYLRVLANPADWLALQRVYNVPTRGIGDKTFGVVWQQGRERGLETLSALLQVESMDLSRKAQMAVRTFGEVMEDLRQIALRGTVQELIDAIGEKTGLRESIQDGTPEGDNRWENVQELKTVGAKFAKRPGEEGLRSFLEEIALFSDLDNLDRQTQKQVTMMTLHAAKGLEFPVVFMVGLEEGLFPHSQSVNNPVQLEEERRLCYVGMTRAREKLYLTYVSQRSLFGNTTLSIPSRFFKDLPKDSTEIVSTP